jgi:two-component system sensor kinase FixL
MTRKAEPSSRKKAASRKEGPDSFVSRLRGILDQMNSILLLVEQDGTLSYWNHPAAERLGDGENGPLGKPFSQRIHPRDARRVRDVLGDIFQEGPPLEEDDSSEIHFRMKGSDGSWIYCIARPRLIDLPDSPLPTCLLNVREDRERRKGEPLQERMQELVEEVEAKSRQLAESEADYRALIEAMNDGFWVLDSEGRILFANEKIAALLGFVPSRLVGKPAVRFLEGAHREIFLQQSHKWSRGRGGRCEVEMTSKDGNRHTCLIRGAPRFDVEGQNLGTICNITDISARKKLENQLRASEKDYRDLFENMQDIICRMTPDGKITALNPAGVRVLGFEKPKDILGRKLRGFFADRSKWKNFEVELAEKGLVEDHIVYFRTRYGDTLAMSVNAHTVLDETGRPQGIDGVFRDVSERIHMETQLQSYAADMEKKNEELESLIYSITHDFKSPLLVVGGLVGRLKKIASPRMDSKSLEYLDWIKLNVSKMEKMVGDLLVFYRADKTLIPFESVSIGSLVDTVLRDVEPLARERNVRMRRKGTFPAVNGYRNRLYQVFYNLVENAIKYMDQTSGAQVEIGCKSREGEYLFSIRDSGPGISPEHQSKIFQIFYTLEPERVSGTGIGLSIVKKIVENHGGRIWVESELGRGTTFFFTLPVSGSA